MVSLQDSHSDPNIASSRASSPPHRHRATRSMRTLRSKLYRQPEETQRMPNELPENLTDSQIDFCLGELVSKPASNSKMGACSSDVVCGMLDISGTMSDFSACSGDISGELQRLASLTYPGQIGATGSKLEPEACTGFSEGEGFSPDISPDDLQRTVKLCVDGLQSPSISEQRSAVAKLRFLAKNQSDNRVLIWESGAVPALIPLLRCSDAVTQEHAVTAILNLSLHDSNKSIITNAGAVKSIIHVLKTGTEASKQNAACALLSLALVEDYKLSIGASGAIPPLVALLINGSNRGKKDALTTLYKLCSVKLNKERAVLAGAVGPLVGLVGEQGTGLEEKAMVVLSSLAGIEMGRDAIVEEGGIAALVEAIEDGSEKGKEFAVLTLLQLCLGSFRNRGFLVREGGIPPLVALSQNGTAKAKHKAETLLGYLREPRQEASSSSP